MSETNNDGVLTLERRGHVLLMGLNRPEKRNAFNVELLIELGRAYQTLDQDDELRCGSCSRTASTSPGGSISPR